MEVRFLHGVLFKNKIFNIILTIGYMLMLYNLAIFVEPKNN
jgi:hypothetical protein